MSGPLARVANAMDIQPAATTLRSPRPSGRSQTVPPRRRLRRFLLPAVLGAGLLGAACGNSSPSPPSRANALISEGIHAESIGHFQQAVRDFRSAAAADPRGAAPYYQLGVLYQQKLKDPTQAAAAYKRALSIKPRYWSAMFNLAIVDTPTQPTAALNLYNDIVLNNRNDASAYFNLGLLLIHQLQPIPGHEALKKAIELDPSLAQRVPTGITP